MALVRTRRTLTAMAMTLAGLLGGCLSVETPVALTPTPLPPTDTPTFVFPTIAPTATLTPAPTGTPTPDLIAGLGPTLFTDDFTQDKGWQLGENDAGAASLLDGRLVVALRLPKALRLSLSHLAAVTDFFVQVTARGEVCGPDDDLGLVFRANNSGEHYRFGLDCTGRFSLVRSLQGGSITMLAPTSTSAALPGPLVDNRLAVVAQGGAFTFFVNDIQVAAVRDNALSVGGLGVFAQSAASAQMTASFSGFIVRLLLSTVTPTPRP